jgi:DNA invertase Pin-like site-specific DNA recombinase
MTVYGYARVSTEGQSLTAQVAELKTAGAHRIYQEKISGALSDRRQLARLLAELDDGDVVLVSRLDRLARSTRDLLNILAKIGKAGAQFKSLRETWADTTTPVGRLMVTIIGGIAEFERELIRAGTGDGRKRARANGVLFGRPRKLTPHQAREALERVESGAPLREIALSYAVDRSTISRLKARHAAEFD